uniref:Uncharacterized protein n=1 Tax=Anguilla anguilla TaxID=7936 RepID=A0A0E9R7P1_ANGAN
MLLYWSSHRQQAYRIRVLRRAKRFIQTRSIAQGLLCSVAAFDRN